MTRVWHPYTLDPHLNSLSSDASLVSKETYYHRRYGVEWYNWAKGTMRQWSNDVGLDITMTGNLSSTVRSHRLFEYARRRGGHKQDTLVGLVFESYFAKEKDCGDADMLAKWAQQVGLWEDEGAAREWLKSTELEDEVRTKAQLIKTGGVGSVPNYTLSLLAEGEDPEQSKFEPVWEKGQQGEGAEGVLKRLIIAGSQDKEKWAKTLEEFVLA